MKFLLSNLIPTLVFLYLNSVSDHLVGAADPYFETCRVPRSCGNQTISFPFYIQGKQEHYCGYPRFNLSCDPNGRSILNFSGQNYVVRQIFYQNQSLLVSTAAFSDPRDERECVPPVRNFTSSPDFELPANQASVVLLYNCRSSSLGAALSKYRIGCSAVNDSNSVLAFYENDRDGLANASRTCGTERVVAKAAAAEEVGYRDGSSVNGGAVMREVLRRGFMLNWIASNCSRCESTKGRCGFDWDSRLFQCYCPDRPHAARCDMPGNKLGLKLGLGIGLPSLAVTCLIVLFLSRHYLRKRASKLLQRNSSDQYINSDTEEGSDYLGVLVFSYKDLQEATNNFNAEKELGDGGFGTVYYGKLKDGREVAVKRLYEHNYKRVEQFINEIEILTRLRHKNLVSLYGCTSRRCRELLLVYEYIPNGTVADHLHGDRANTGPLSWPIRMSIAIETASALAYLHASDIVHRDVKTNNILLDNNFCVKVADFGLSRLFPNDVTHVSTAPQGTPGYVDPEYHQCYQLTSKSDVYSFGVVLVELISSMPAVDITRHRHEINLSNLALSKIQKRAYNELVDPCLGFDTDIEVKTMIIAVAELAFQCLQQDKEMRPSMDEVLESLKAIEIGNSESENHQKEEAFDGSGLSMSTVRPPPSPDCDEVVLLRRMKPEHPPSPNSVTENWPSSRSTTPNISG